MAKIGDMLESKYLKQSDIGDDDIVATVAKIGRANIAKEDDTPEYKWLCRFEEFDKPMVLNATNIHALGEACGSDDTDDWLGKQVVVYVDPNVSYSGKRVGGIRIKAVKRQKAVTGKPASNPVADMDDNIPFDNPYKGKRSYVE